MIRPDEVRSPQGDAPESSPVAGRDVLREAGIDYSRGYGYSEPVRADEVIVRRADVERILYERDVWHEKVKFLGKARAGATTAGRAPCVWTPDEDGVWETTCGGRWEFNVGTPAENNCRFCIYCGGPLKDGSPSRRQRPSVGGGDRE